MVRIPRTADGCAGTTSTAQDWTYSAVFGPADAVGLLRGCRARSGLGPGVVAGVNPQGGVGNIWLYDTATDTIQTGPRFPAAIGYAHDIVYFPPDDSFYVFQSDGRVWRMTSAARTSMLTSVTALNVTGRLLPRAAAADSPTTASTRMIGGNVTNGTFYTFDPASLAWTSSAIKIEAGSVGSPNQAFHCLDFDPVSGCYRVPGRGDRSRPRGSIDRQRDTGGASSASPVADLSVTLDFGGGKIAAFAGAEAVNQGDFVGEFVRQKCYLARNPAFPDWRVYFRVDADAERQAHRRRRRARRGDRRVWPRERRVRPSMCTSSYTATIAKAGTAVATYSVPAHWWYSRWRYQSSARPVVRTPATLMARGWIANFTSAGLFGLQPNTTAVTWSGPMSAPPGFSNTMAAGGDNHQIGFLTEFAADYAIHQTQPSLTSLRTEGEWCGNWCMHIRDDATGAVLDVRNNKLKYKADGGTVNDLPGVNPATAANFVALESAHFYPCANMPWLLTEDPFFLEELQFACNWQLLFNQYHRSLQNLQGLVYPGETRSFAWGLRDCSYLPRLARSRSRNGCAPGATGGRASRTIASTREKFQKSPARIHALFKTWTRSDADPAWQASWLNAVIGIAVGQGFANWTPIFQWGVDKHIQQTNGTSGWPRQWPVPYYSIPNKAAVWGTPTGLFATTAVDATTCTSWADYWAYYKSGSPDAAGVGHTDTSGVKINDAGWDGHTIMQSQSGPSFFLHLRAVLAVAAGRGIPGAQASYDYIHGELTNEVMPRFKVKGQARFSIDPTPVALPARTANVQGLWWNDPPGSESGWGLNLAQQGTVLFATWFTYDAAGKPWWLSMAANKVSDNAYAGDLLATSGPAFDAVPFDPGRVEQRGRGLRHAGVHRCRHGNLQLYRERQPARRRRSDGSVFADPVPLCAFGAGPAVATTNYQDLWWADPPESEAGWGINVTHQGDVIFATWFTYDFDGSPQWLVATTDRVADGQYKGTLYRTSGPPFHAEPFDPDAVARVPVGEVTLAFHNSSTASFEYVLDGVAQTKRITRQVFRTPGTACQ